MTQNKLSRVEGFLQYNTLTIVPTLLKNKNTILDLRNETSVAGTIDDVDGWVNYIMPFKIEMVNIQIWSSRYMNVTMKNAVFMDQRNNQHSFESYFVPARTIRYIHIPESVSKIGNRHQSHGLYQNTLIKLSA